MIIAPLPNISMAPRTIKNMPPTMEMAPRALRNREMYCAPFPALAAMRRKGIARPTENMMSKNIPEIMDTDVDASNKMVPNIGPTQGVHPSANALPSINEFIIFPRSNNAGTRRRAL